MGKTRDMCVVTIVLKIEGKAEDAKHAIEGILDDGTLQESIQGYDYGTLNVLSALVGNAVDVADID